MKVEIELGIILTPKRQLLEKIILKTWIVEKITRDV